MTVRCVAATVFCVEHATLYSRPAPPSASRYSTVDVSRQLVTGGGVETERDFSGPPRCPPLLVASVSDHRYNSAGGSRIRIVSIVSRILTGQPSRTGQSPFTCAFTALVSLGGYSVVLHARVQVLSGWCRNSSVPVSIPQLARMGRGACATPIPTRTTLGLLRS
ncbi:hypothetical protein EDB89DRAFT_106050 [Lactarius sanguifluus]|nr:hypothetical protein EDB89DRAFT_106050 [Lactarius sanguifluus]